MKKVDDKRPDFVKRDELSREFESIISSEILSRSKPISASTSFSPSTITECPRRLLYRIMETKTDKTSNYSALSSDVFGKKKWMDYFRKFKGIKLIEENLMAADCNYNISGILDAVIQILDTKVATQIFFVHSFDFLAIKKEGAFRKNVIELLIYMWLTEINDGLLIYEDRDTNDCLSFHIEPYQPIIASVQKQCSLLMENKIKGKIPERPYKNKFEKLADECNRCEYLKPCWN